MGEKSHYEINVFLKYTLDKIIGTPRNSYMSKISLKYIPIHIHNFEHSTVMNEIIQPWLPVSQKYK